jgi:hypothetical protein
MVRSYAVRGTLLAATLTALSGCDLVGVGGCTLVGCNSGLTVALPVRPAGAFRVEVLVAGGNPAYVYDCPDPERCTSRPFFLDFTPTVAVVVVTTERGQVRQEVRPSYSTSRPNGGDCPPVCRQATVTVSLPA